LLQVFQSDEYVKTISVPIVNDFEFEPDTDFYIILKNPEGDAGLGDPSVTRVTIIDDDGRHICIYGSLIYYSINSC